MLPGLAQAPELYGVLQMLSSLLMLGVARSGVPLPAPLSPSFTPQVLRQGRVFADKALPAPESGAPVSAVQGANPNRVCARSWYGGSPSER